MHLDVAVLKLISNESESAKKKMHFSGLLFFLSTLEASASAFMAVRIGSNLKKNLRKKIVYVIIILKIPYYYII